MEYPGRNDSKTLLERCSKGDEKAWGSFVEAFGPLVSWTIKNKAWREGLGLNSHDIDDIFQQTFSRIWQKNSLANIKRPDAIEAWLVIVTQNTTNDFLRNRSSSLKLTFPKQIEEDQTPAPDNPRVEVDNNQLYKTIESIISDLPLKERRIMALELFYDFKHREIADIMAMPVNSVSTVVARIKKDLKDKLKRRGYDV